MACVLKPSKPICEVGYYTQASAAANDGNLCGKMSHLTISLQMILACDESKKLGRVKCRSMENLKMIYLRLTYDTQITFFFIYYLVGLFSIYYSG